MGIELYIIKIKNNTIDIFSENNHEILEIISMNIIYNCHPQITNYILHCATIENKNDKSLFRPYMCQSENFVSIIEFIEIYNNKIKKDLDEQNEQYKKSKVLKFLKDNSYEKIENLLKNRLYTEYKELMNKFMDIISKDFDDNYEIYEYDSHLTNVSIYNKIKNISDKLTQYINHNDIYCYLSY